MDFIIKQIDFFDLGIQIYDANFASLRTVTKYLTTLIVRKWAQNTNNNGAHSLSWEDHPTGR